MVKSFGNKKSCLVGFLLLCFISWSGASECAIVSDQENLRAQIEGAKQLGKNLSGATPEENQVIAWFWESEPVSGKDPQKLESPKTFRKEPSGSFSHDLLAEGKALFVQAENVLAGSGTASVVLQKKQAWVLYGESQWKDARNAYEAIPVEAQDFWTYWRLGDLWAGENQEKSYQYFEKAYGMQKNMNPEIAIRVGNSAYSAKKYVRAIELYTAAMSAGNTSDEILLYRGNAFYLAGNLGAAIQDYSTGILKDPTRQEFYLNRARAYGALSDPLKAGSDYGKLLSMSPENTELWSEFTEYLVDTKQPINAMQEANRWITIQPGKAEAWNFRGTLKYEQKQFVEALADFEQATKLDSSFATAWYNQAITLEQIGIPKDWPLDKKWQKLDQIKSCYGKFIQFSSAESPGWERANRRITEIENNSGQFLDI